MDVRVRSNLVPMLLEPLPRLLALSVLLGAFGHAAHAQNMCQATEHGMRADGSDNTAALTKILVDCAGKTIHIAHGTYTFSPKGFAAGLKVPAGTTLAGDGAQGPQATVLKIAPEGTFQGLLWIRDVSNVAIRGLRFEGTPYESGCHRGLDYGHAIYIQSDAKQSEGVDNVVVNDNLFHDFNGMSWVTMSAAEGSPGIGVKGPITIKNNVFESDANLKGDCVASRGMDYRMDMISAHGSDLSGHGLVENVHIESNTFKAGYAKGAISIWSSTKDIDIAHNTILDTGMRVPWAPNTELGRYAIVIYDSAHERPGLPPDAIRVTDNTIQNPMSCGVYVAVGRNLEITGNRISGQRDRHDGTLPKGAISLNHALSVTALRDNELKDNYIAISSVASHVNMGTNHIEVPRAGKAQRIVPP